jgi:hypothetical protein
MIDDLARTAVADLRTATSSDVEAGLRDVYAGHRRRRRESVLAASAAVALAMGVGWWGGQAMGNRAPSTPQPVQTPPVVQSKSCSGAIHCLGAMRYRLDLTRPVTWHLPPGYRLGTGSDVTDWQGESDALTSADGGGPYMSDTVAGVTVLEGVRAASADGGSARADVADTPRAFVTWLAAQPYLQASSVEAARVNGHPAWHVRVSVVHGAGDGPAACDDRHSCFATTITPDHHVTGIRSGMVADYTAFALPGAGTTVVWSWAFSHDRSALARNSIAVRGLSWADDPRLTPAG